MISGSVDTTHLGKRRKNWEEILVRDPWNRTVRITRKQWEGHVLDHHSEMASRLDMVVDTIRDPDVTTIPGIDGSRRNYYAHHGRRLNVLAVVSFGDGDAHGYLVTAHLLRGMRKGEEIEWKKN